MPKTAKSIDLKCPGECWGKCVIIKGVAEISTKGVDSKIMKSFIRICGLASFAPKQTLSMSNPRSRCMRAVLRAAIN